jgi:cytochrome bd-type quinol oxidase subunit 1
MSHLSTSLAEALAEQRDLGVRGIWLAIIVLAASLVAPAAGVLTWVAKRQPPTVGPSAAFDSRTGAAAILYAGVAFGGTITVLLGIYYFLVR